MTSSCQIKDANGADNYDLSTYTLEDVKNNNIFKSSAIGKVESGFLNSGFLSVKKFSGQRTLVTRNIKNSDSVKITSTIKSGNLAIFIKYGDEYHQIPVNTEYTFVYDGTEKYTSVMVVGESARFKVSYDFDIK